VLGPFARPDYATGVPGRIDRADSQYAFLAGAKVIEEGIAWPPRLGQGFRRSRR
jgi:hypothetical protein